MLPQPFDLHRWVRLKIEIFTACGWHCFLCGRKRPLLLHHTSYRDYFARENLWPICEECHICYHSADTKWRIKHNIHDGYKPELVRLWFDRLEAH